MTSLIPLNENPDLEPDLTLTTQTVAYLEVPVSEAQRLKSGTSGYVSIVLACTHQRGCREVVPYENFVEIIPVFSTFFNFFKKKIIKAILCNFSMRLLKYFLKNFKFFFPSKYKKNLPQKLLIIPLDQEF